MTTNAEAKGRFGWYDLNTTDVEAAKKFYTELVGWGIENWSGADMPYAMWVGPRGPVGGVMTLPEEAKKMGAPPHWIAYVIVPSVEETIEQAKKLGGEVLMPPMDIPTVGRFAVLRDPFGAVFCPFASAEEVPGHDDEAQSKEFCWHELMTPDVDASWKFYNTLFGWDKMMAMDMGPEMGPYQTYGRKGVGLGGMMKKPAEMPGPAVWLLYVQVDDATKAAEKAKSLGATIMNGPMDIPGGVVAQLIDPQGAAFAVHATKAGPGSI